MALRTSVEELRAQIKKLSDVAQTVGTLAPAVRKVVEGIRGLVGEVKAGNVTLEEVQALLADFAVALEKVRADAGSEETPPPTEPPPAPTTMPAGKK